jgi:hypothetical protein
MIGSALLFAGFAAVFRSYIHNHFDLCRDKLDFLIGVFANLMQRELAANADLIFIGDIVDNGLTRNIVCYLFSTLFTTRVSNGFAVISIGFVYLYVLSFFTPQ